MGFEVQRSGFRVQYSGSGCGVCVQDVRFRVQDVGFTDLGFGRFSRSTLASCLYVVRGFGSGAGV